MNVKQLKSQSILMEALQEALCELSDARLRNLTITEVELSVGKESAKVFLDANSLLLDRKETLGLLKRASSAIRANLHASLDWYKVPNLSFAIDDSLEQINKLDSIFKQIHANAESAKNGVESVESAKNSVESVESAKDSAESARKSNTKNHNA